MQVNAAVVDPTDAPAPPPLADGDRVVAALVEKGRLKEADLARAQRVQEDTGGELLALIARLGIRR